MRLDWGRNRKQPRLGDAGGSHRLSGAVNGVCSRGEGLPAIRKAHLGLPEATRRRVGELMHEAHVHGSTCSGRSM